MKNKFLFLVVLLLSAYIPVYADNCLPLKYQGDWNLLMVSQDDSHFTQCGGYIGKMYSRGMYSQNELHMFNAIEYDDEKQIGIITHGNRIWEIYSNNIVKIYRVNRAGVKQYMFTMWVEIN